MLFLSFFLVTAEILGPQPVGGGYNAYWEKPPTDVVSLLSTGTLNGKDQARTFAANLEGKHVFVTLEKAIDIRGKYTIMGSCNTDESGLNGIFRIQDAKNESNKYTAIVCGAKTQEAFVNFLLTLLDTYNRRETIFKTKDIEAGGNLPQGVDTMTPKRFTHPIEVVPEGGATGSTTSTVNIEEAIDAALNAEELANVQGWTFTDFANAISLLGGKNSRQKDYSKLREQLISNFFDLFVSSAYEVGKVDVPSESSLVLSPSPAKSKRTEKSPSPQPNSEQKIDDSQMVVLTSINIGAWDLDLLEHAVSYIEQKHDNNEECKKFLQILKKRIASLKTPRKVDDQEDDTSPHSGEVSSQNSWQEVLGVGARLLQDMTNSPARILTAAVTVAGVIVWLIKPKV